MTNSSCSLTQFSNGHASDSNAITLSDYPSLDVETISAADRFRDSSNQSSGVSHTAYSLAVLAAFAIGSATTPPVSSGYVTSSAIVASGPLPRSSKAERAVALLREWLADESGYDEAIWPEVRRMIDEDRLSDRELFHG